MSKDKFHMAARGVNGQLRRINFAMDADDQRSVSSFGCDLLRQRTGVDGWTPLVIEWLNRPNLKA